MNDQTLRQIISMQNRIYWFLYGNNKPAEARSQQPGDNASLTDKASTRNGYRDCTERHANDTRREQ